MTERAHAVNTIAKVSDAIRDFTAAPKGAPLGELSRSDDGEGLLPQNP